ncbi:transposase [Actinospica sp. MGRD01-02]|uniref:Transposase n=1 Tax=Actinospica acidithermotolerans TaxID=2828514 RepID=A0A941IH28_9ACTN|nr:transposase [Actinospica acidithermotolerans]MBR7825282.1 transposase [Actinospica acidithermotolerans]
MAESIRIPSAAASLAMPPRPRAPRGPAGLAPGSPSGIGAPALGAGLPKVPRPRRSQPLGDPEIDDELWARIEPLIPVKVRRRRYPGRMPLDDRAVLTGILVVLARGIGFERLPKELGYGSGMTCWRRLRDWQQAGVWPAIAQLLANELPDGRRLDFRRVAAPTGPTGPDTPVTRRPTPPRAKQPSAVAAEFGMTLLR